MGRFILTSLIGRLVEELILTIILYIVGIKLGLKKGVPPQPSPISSNGVAAALSRQVLRIRVDKMATP